MEEKSQSDDLVNILAFFPTKKFDSDNISGANIHVTELIENLSDRDTSLTVIGAHSSNTEVDKVNVKTTKTVSFPVIGKILPLIHGLFQASHHLMTNQEDVIYSRSDLSSVFVLLLSTIFRTPSVVEVNGISETEAVHHNPNSLVQKLKSASDIFSDRNLHRHDYLVAVTPEIKSILVDRYDIDPERIEVVPNGANTTLFRPSDKLMCREELGLDSDRIYITFVGNFLPWQGLEHVLKSVPKITTKCPSAQFLLVGDGPSRPQLERLADQYDIEDDVIFTGKVNYTNVPKYINASDLCVVYKNPVDFGYSPLKLYEYLACGTPIVASDIEGLRVVEELDCGQVVEPEQPDKFAEAVIDTLGDSKITHQSTIRGREYVLNNHSWEVVSESIHSVCATATGDNE